MASSEHKGRSEGHLLGESALIFVTVGTSPRNFSRMLGAADRAIVDLGEIAVFQIGYSRYVPQGAHRVVRFLKESDYHDYISEATAIVAHGGIGTLIASVRAGRRIVVVPRRRQFGEIDDDHQLELFRIVKELGLGPSVRVIDDETEILQVLKEVLAVDPPRIEAGSVFAERIAMYVEETIRKRGSVIGGRRRQHRDSAT